MTIETLTLPPKYTVSGIGPYNIPHGYAEGSIQVFIDVDGTLLQALASDYGVAPLKSESAGDVTLQPTFAAAHDGRDLFIVRKTVIEQGWKGLGGAREAGLEQQLDLLALGVQDHAARIAGSLRVLDAAVDGLLPTLTADASLQVNSAGNGFVMGPTSAAIAAAQQNAQDAQAALDAFDGTYLGAKAADPATDNDGDALMEGALYFDTVAKLMKVYNGTIWVFVAADISTALIKAANLGDLNHVPTAINNLGLGSAALSNTSEFATAAQGTKADDALPADSKADQATAEAGINNTDYMTSLTTRQAIRAVAVAPDVTETFGPDFPTHAALISPASTVSVRPANTRCFVECVVASDGYSVGDQIEIASTYHHNTGGILIIFTATSMEIKFGSVQFTLNNKVTGNAFQVRTNPSRWKLVVQIWL